MSKHQPILTKAACFRLGEEAFYAGKRATDCPHKMPLFRAAWHQGWQAAEIYYRDEINAKMESDSP